MATNKEKKRYANNIARTAIKLLESERSDKIKFNMGFYGATGEMEGANFVDDKWDSIKPFDQKNECGTVCCFAGYGPIALNNSWAAERAGMHNHWSDYIEYTFGDEPVFLFGGSWPNSRKQAAARAVVWLETEGNPPGRNSFSGGYNYKRRYLNHLSKDQIIARLEKFLIKKPALV